MDSVYPKRRAEGASISRAAFPSTGAKLSFVFEFGEQELGYLGDPARTAVLAAVDRVMRAVAIKDVEAMIGSAKDLSEGVAKVTIGALGGSYGANADLNGLGHAVLEVLGLHPSGLHGEQALQKLHGSLIAGMQALGELRNRHGTGHGRPSPSPLPAADAAFAVACASAWTKWVLAAAARVFVARAEIAKAARSIAEDVFRRGEIPALLQTLNVQTLSAPDQRLLGLAVSRRWTSGHTFLARDDVVVPLARGEAEYPTAFADGVLTGLLVDETGYFVGTMSNADLAVELSERIPNSDRQNILRDLQSVIQSAPVRPLGPSDESVGQRLIALANGIAQQETKAVWLRIGTDVSAGEGSGTTQNDRPS